MCHPNSFVRVIFLADLFVFMDDSVYIRGPLCCGFGFGLPVWAGHPAMLETLCENAEQTENCSDCALLWAVNQFGMWSNTCKVFRFYYFIPLSDYIILLFTFWTIKYHINRKNKPVSAGGKPSNTNRPDGAIKS